MAQRAPQHMLPRRFVVCLRPIDYVNENSIKFWKIFTGFVQFLFRKNRENSTFRQSTELE